MGHIHSHAVYRSTNELGWAAIGSAIMISILATCMSALMIMKNEYSLSQLSQNLTFEQTIARIDTCRNAVAYNLAIDSNYSGNAPIPVDSGSCTVSEINRAVPGFISTSIAVPAYQTILTADITFTEAPYVLTSLTIH